MQINNSTLLNRLLTEVDLTRLQVGQRLEVEILSNDPNQEGMISLGGKILKAKLEAQVQTGERFWAAVKELGDKEIVLSRELFNNPKLESLTREQIITLVNRGFGFDTEISETLAQFGNSKTAGLVHSLLSSSNPQLKDLLKMFLKALPTWSTLKGTNYVPLQQYFAVLGLENEKLIHDSFRQKNEQAAFEQTNIKINLLKILDDDQADSLSKEERTWLNKLLEDITGQQLWIQSGIKKNAYLLLHFPLQDNGQLYQCKVAVESSRKGRRIDMEHSRIALQVETPNLGIVGADIMIYEDNLNVCLLHDEIDILRPLIEEVYDDTAASFRDLGLQLGRVSLKSLKDDPGFLHFISGRQRSGVDIRG